MALNGTGSESDLYQIADWNDLDELRIVTSQNDSGATISKAQPVLLVVEKPYDISGVAELRKQAGDQ